MSPPLDQTESCKGILGEIFVEAPVRAHHPDTSIINICPDLTQYWIFEPVDSKSRPNIPDTGTSPEVIDEFALLEEKVASNEITREEAEIQKKIREISTCPYGYLFMRKEEEKLYRCTGGLHSVTFEQLGIISDEHEDIEASERKLNDFYSGRKESE
ncbi:hypothetical protein C8Q75DRAFT_437990 [Abortiporus biennis]|nr:hypothetical protein C8Q75DRAFT_437990 [Abortiporus biennis]